MGGPDPARASATGVGPGDANFADALTRLARERPAACALRYAGVESSFALLEQAVWGFATHLHRRGVRRGDAVIALVADEPTLMIALLACARLGAPILTLLPGTPAAVIVDAAGRAQARWLLTDAERSGHVPGCEVLAIGRELAIAAGAPVDASVRDPSPSAPLLLVWGSGSTGRPKLIAIGHERFTRCLRLCAESLSLGATDGYASMIHLSYSSPKERALATMFAGGTAVLIDRRGADLERIVDADRISILEATVVHAHHLLALARRRPLDLSHLRVLLLTASTVGDALRRAIAQRLQAPLWIRYGTNETGLISICPPADALGRPGSVGRVHPDVEVELVRADGGRCDAGEIGEVRVRSPAMIDAYVGDAAASARAFRDGWFHPGDLARMDADGQLVFCGRADDMMIFDGNNIYPAHIEAQIALHPSVRDAVAFALSDPVHQDVPACAVVLDPERPVGEDELVAHCARRMGHAGPRRVVVLDRIPRNEQGKPMRAELLREARARLEPAPRA